MHRLFNFLSLSLLVGVKDVRFLRGQPRQHLVEFGLVRPMPKHEHLPRVDAPAGQQVVKMHWSPKSLPRSDGNSQGLFEVRGRRLKSSAPIAPISSGLMPTQSSGNAAEIQKWQERQRQVTAARAQLARKPAAAGK